MYSISSKDTDSRSSDVVSFRNEIQGKERREKKRREMLTKSFVQTNWISEMKKVQQ